MSVNGITSRGKAPAQERDPHPAHHERRLVNVQPARLDDLQPKYAQTIRHDDENPDAHGWYASCSKYYIFSFYTSCAHPRSNLTPRNIYLVHSLGQCIGFCGAFPCCLCCPNPFKPVNQGQVGLVSKFGRFVTPMSHPHRRTVMLT
jgi:hypothetical protein